MSKRNRYDYYSRSCGYADLCHNWSIAKNNEIGATACHRMHFYGNNMYSYSSLIAKKFPEIQLLVVDSNYEHYSTTTSHQLRCLYDAFSHWTIVSCADIADKNIKQMLQAKKKYLLETMKKVPLRKNGAPVHKNVREEFIRVVTSYFTMINLTETKDLFTEKQKEQVTDFTNKINKYNAELIKRNEERLEKQRIQDEAYRRQDDETRKKAIEYIKNQLELGKGILNTQIQVDKFIKEVQESIEFRTQFKQARYSEYTIHLDEKDLHGIVEQFLGFTNTYVGQYGNQIQKGDMMYIDQHLDLRTSRWATINHSQVMGVYKLLKIYLSTTDVNELSSKLSGKHCGPFLIGAIFEDHIRVGCHTFARNYLEFFKKEFDKFYKDKYKEEV